MTTSRSSAETPRTVWFYREYTRLTGGQVKHADYFEHVRRSPGFAPRLMLGGAKLNARQERERRELWPVAASDLAAQWTPQTNDLLFLAGTDWRFLRSAGLERLGNPRLNLVQHVRHAHAGSELYGYLSQRAIRICVSDEVADAIRGTGRANGPIIAIPNGIDIAPRPVPRAQPPSAQPAIAIIDYKRRELGAALRRVLDEAGIPYVALAGFLPRSAFLRLLAAVDVAVCLPHEEEGFYLPALEAMASGCIAVTLDCVGNRGFCHHRRNCLIAAPTAQSLCAAVQEAIGIPADRREAMLREASDTVRRHSLAAERTRFDNLLQDIGNIW